MPACSAPGARFIRANLTGAFMRNGGFEKADFTGATLRDADVGRARFAGALFAGADLRATNLAEANLREALADSETIWPDGFVPEAHGVIMRSRIDVHAR